ncbi:type II secretion system protein G [Limihaloglobus sulfuriphilus]|uniref:Type II secretion system protein G n=1 Tax=Limihaloglobus sulfuriphilus TaxID=1851148 RepID=A0A1Q2MEF1_9BACT|nr:type II secretion system protein [Limihaloglobus sulfuriphilus]AQQ71083.1 type II secretion system protein G [Limihaloglobus sulfuriphilus]
MYKRAFTLIELLVVIAVIALLMGILLPTLGRAKIIARRTICQSNLKQISLAFEMYCHDNNSTYIAADDPVSGGVWLWMGRGFRGWIKPYLDNSSGNTAVLSCPGDITAEDKYESTSYAYSMSFYYSPEQINSIDSTAGTYGTECPIKSTPQRRENVALASQKILCGEWLSNHDKKDGDMGWWCSIGSRNFVMADGSVVFLAAEDIEEANDGLPDPNLTRDGISGFDVKR